MAAIKLPPPTHYTLDDLAGEWGCHPDRLMAYGAAGLLEVLPLELNGATVQAVSYQERQRFEAECLLAEEAHPMNTTERRTLLNLVAVLSYIAYRDDVSRAYSLARQIEQEAATHNLPLRMGDETLANKLKDAFASMRSQGCKAFQAHTEEEGA